MTVVSGPRKDSALWTVHAPRRAVQRRRRRLYGEHRIDPAKRAGNGAGGRYTCRWTKGTAVGYAVQGKVADLPRAFAESASAFRGMRSEAGVLPDIDRASGFVKAWLIDGTEVDELPVPERELRRHGIGCRPGS